MSENRPIHKEVESLWGEIDLEGLDRVIERIKRKEAESDYFTLKKFEKGPQNKEIPSQKPIFFDPKELDI
jgi:hypothetical protein